MIIVIITATVLILLVSIGLICWSDKLYSEITSINFKLQKLRKELDTNSHLIRQNTCTTNEVRIKLNRVECEQQYSSQKVDNLEKSTKEEIENIKNQIVEPYKII